MDAEEGAARVKEIYRDQVKKRGSQAEASRLLARSSTYVNGQLKHAAGLRAGDQLLSLQKLGCCLPQEAYHQALFPLDTDPAAMLEFAREHQKLSMDRFLSKLRPRLLALAGATTEVASDWPSRSEEIRQLDLLRRRDRDQAKTQLQQVLLEMVEELEATKAKSRQGLSELTRALGVLAAIYRLAGRRDDAVDVLLPAWPLARLAQSPQAKAEWYQKAAYLLVDLGNNPRAYNFVLEAHRFYDIAGAEVSRLGTLVDSAYVLTHAGYHAQSREMLEPLFPRLPEADIEVRLAAYQLLAGNLQALGDLAGACDYLGAAIELVDGDLLAHASCLWRRGKLLLELGDIPRALDLLAEAMPLNAKLSGAAELAELAMEYAGVLVKEGRRSELRSLATDLAVWLDQLRANLKLCEAIADFHSLIEVDALDDCALAAIVGQIQATKRAKSQKQR